MSIAEDEARIAEWEAAEKKGLGALEMGASTNHFSLITNHWLCGKR